METAMLSSQFLPSLSVHSCAPIRCRLRRWCRLGLQWIPNRGSRQLRLLRRKLDSSYCETYTSVADFIANWTKRLLVHTRECPIDKCSKYWVPYPLSISLLTYRNVHLQTCIYVQVFRFERDSKVFITYERLYEMLHKIDILSSFLVSILFFFFCKI